MITKRQNRINAEAVMKHPWMTSSVNNNKQMELNNAISVLYFISSSILSFNFFYMIFYEIFFF